MWNVLEEAAFGAHRRKISWKSPCGRAKESRLYIEGKCDCVDYYREAPFKYTCLIAEPGQARLNVLQVEVSMYAWGQHILMQHLYNVLPVRMIREFDLYTEAS